MTPQLRLNRLLQPFSVGISTSEYRNDSDSLPRDTADARTESTWGELSCSALPQQSFFAISKRRMASNVLPKNI